MWLLGVRLTNESLQTKITNTTIPRGIWLQRIYLLGCGPYSVVKLTNISEEGSPFSASAVKQRK
jgi:hypothetical protein